MAAGWERDRETLAEVSREIEQWLVDAIDPKPGETVLELAAGAGDTGLRLASRVAPGGRLISSDFSPQMVEVARRRAAELGVVNVEFRVLDAQELDLGDECVEAVVSRWGYMLMEDVGAALAETRRVLRPDGRVALSVWAGPAENPWAAAPAQTFVALGLMAPPDPHAPGIFSMADPTRVHALLTEAGLVETRLEHVEMTWRFPSFDAYWTFLTDLAGAISMVAAELSPTEAAHARAALSDVVAPYRGPAGLMLPGVCLNALARRAE